jgi:hypothetical protein
VLRTERRRNGLPQLRHERVERVLQTKKDARHRCGIRQQGNPPASQTPQ